MAHEWYTRFNPGLSSKVIDNLSVCKDEPAWMAQLRLKAFSHFQNAPNPEWGADLSELSYADLCYYLQPIEQTVSDWKQLPIDIQNTFNALGIPQAERNWLAGVGAQVESTLVYQQIQQELLDRGVIFCDITQAMQSHEPLIKKYFGSVIPLDDNKFAALNTAVWSGGSFLYVPEGVHIKKPLQAYFRINQERMGQFERTLIIAERGSSVHYVEGCSAPLHRTNSLHSAVVEIIAHENAQVRYTTIQNWSKNIFNLVTKRAIAHAGARVSWIDGNFGSKVTMKYPCIVLAGLRARGEIISLSVASSGQELDAGGKIIHLAPDTTSQITAKSLCNAESIATYRGLIKVCKGAENAQSHVTCDTLFLNEKALSKTIPVMQVDSAQAECTHEASISSITVDQLFYLQSRGFSSAQAQALLVNGFIESFVNLLPMEYALEINNLIKRDMEGSIG